MSQQLLNREVKGCFDYFHKNFSRGPLTYGLMPDRLPHIHNECSVAANGFMLAAMAAGADLGYISPDEARSICEDTLSTFFRLEHDNGFFYHFYSLEDGSRSRRCELSIIDSALFFAGALTAGARFGGRTLALARELLHRCNWRYFYDPDRKMFYMGRFDERGFSGHWDCYAEQLILYFLAASSPSGQDFAREAYYAFTRHRGSYSGEEYIYSWFGSLFTHQFSHAFLDFRGTVDANGTNWFQNSVKASLDNRRYCIANADKFPGYGADGWGLTSCITPKGYVGNIGCAPSGNGNSEHLSEGTIAPCGALGSLPFTPRESLAALKNYYSLPQLVGEYGLRDAYNAGQDWYSDSYISIDKGITLLMAANYMQNSVWKHFCSLPEIKKAFEILEFKKENV